MDHSKKTPAESASNGDQITDADLHGYVDNQLPPLRRAAVEQYLEQHPEKRRLVQDWERQNELMRNMLNPVLDEPVPQRIPLTPRAARFPWRGLAAGIAIAAIGASSGWIMRGSMDALQVRLVVSSPAGLLTAGGGNLSGFARRAAVAHVVYSPEVRRPVEIGAEQEQQLVAWLSKRLGTPIKPPTLQAIGYELIGGRLLPGDSGPVAQFMYHDAMGQRLTLYVTREVPKAGKDPETAFRFGRDGPVNVFYWVDKDFGYAISGGANRSELMRVSLEVYKQLDKA